MKKLKKLLPIIITVLIIAFVYSFFHIGGWEIKNVKELNDAKIVTVVVSDENSDESIEYELSKNQIELLQNLLKENSYKRRLSSTIIGVLPDKRYSILANWNDNGQKHLHISLLGGEYIRFWGQYGSHYHEIKNPDFEKVMISILEAK